MIPSASSPEPGGKIFPQGHLGEKDLFSQVQSLTDKIKKDSQVFNSEEIREYRHQLAEMRTALKDLSIGEKSKFQSLFHRTVKSERSIAQQLLSEAQGFLHTAERQHEEYERIKPYFDRLPEVNAENLGVLSKDLTYLEKKIKLIPNNSRLLEKIRDWDQKIQPLLGSKSRYEIAQDTYITDLFFPPDQENPNRSLMTSVLNKFPVLTYSELKSQFMGMLPVPPKIDTPNIEFMLCQRSLSNLKNHPELASEVKAQIEALPSVMRAHLLKEFAKITSQDRVR